jgi:signal transduction histidine kinase
LKRTALRCHFNLPAKSLPWHRDCTLAGAGIPEDKPSHVFEPFSQATGSSTSSNREHQGAGLGLSIVKRIAALMDGSVSIASEEGRGTTVYVSLSFSQPLSTK